MWHVACSVAALMAALWHSICTRKGGEIKKGTVEGGVCVGRIE